MRNCERQAMKGKKLGSWFNEPQQAAIILACLIALTGFPGNVRPAWSAEEAPQPLLAKGQPVDWWFVFKFNSAAFAGCGEGIARQCIFGGDAGDYPRSFGQQ